MTLDLDGGAWGLVGLARVSLVLSTIARCSDLPLVQFQARCCQTRIQN